MMFQLFDDIPIVKIPKDEKPQYFIYCFDGLGGLLFLVREGHSDCVTWGLVLHGTSRRKPTRWKALWRVQQILAEADEFEWWRWYTLQIGVYSDIDRLIEVAKKHRSEVNNNG